MRQAAARLAVLATSCLSATLAVIAATPVRAAEAYLCEAGRVVYVELGDLERMKRTDACIAGYYGLTVEGAAPSVPPAAAGERSASATEIAAPQQAASAKPGSPSTFAARSATPGRRPAGLKDTSVRTIDMTRASRGAAPVAAPETDYRNVRVINASTGDGQWFRHDF